MGSGCRKQAANVSFKAAGLAGATDRSGSISTLGAPPLAPLSPETPSSAPHQTA